MKKRRALAMPFLITTMLSPGFALADDTPPPVKKKLPKSQHPDRISRHPDGTCWEMPSMECPPNVHCNPGPPHEVQCPPETDKKK